MSYGRARSPPKPNVHSIQQEYLQQRSLHSSEEHVSGVAAVITLLLGSLSWLWRSQDEDQTPPCDWGPPWPGSASLSVFSLAPSILICMLCSLATLQPAVLFHALVQRVLWTVMPLLPTLDCPGEAVILLYVPTQTSTFPVKPALRLAGLEAPCPRQCPVNRSCRPFVGLQVL